MANVLNKVSKEYRESVNTPDFPESDWVINPDLSAVMGTPSCYWWIDSQVETVQGIVGYDENEEPIYGDVSTTTYSVRLMTTEERAAYDAAHIPTIQFTGKLADGTPAYIYREIPISVNSRTIDFTADTAGSRNFYLRLENSSLMEEPVVVDSLIKSIHVTAASGIFTLVLKAGERIVYSKAYAGDFFEGVALPVNVGESLTCFIAALSDVAYPKVSMQVAQR